MGIFDIFFKPQMTPMQEIANNFARSVIVSAAVSTDVVYKKIRPDDNTDFMNVVAEFVCVYCHAIDRNAFRTLGPEKRNSFNVELETRCMNYLPEICQKYEPVNEIIKSPRLLQDFFISKLEQRMPVYERMRELWQISETDSPQGTVFWEFGKTISETYFNSNSTDAIFVSMYCVQAFIEFDNNVGGMQKKLQSLK